MWAETTTAHFDWGLPAPTGILEPEMLDVDRFLPQYRAQFEDHGLTNGDVIWVAVPPLAVPWHEAITGCRPRYSIPAGSMAGDHVGGDWTAYDPAALLVNNPWLDKLIEFTEGLVELSAGRFPVGLPIGRGPWDIAAAYLGHSDVFLELYDHPDEMRAFGAKLAWLWNEITRRLAAIIPPWHGGYVNRFGLWTPEMAVMPQDDASVSVSGEMYRAVMAPADGAVLRPWPGALFHLHSSGLQVADALIEMLDGRAMNVVIDDRGPAPDQLVEQFARIQTAGVALHILAFRPEDVAAFRAGLSPAGLAITYQPMDTPR